MHIITTLPRYSDGEVNRSFMRLIHTASQQEVAGEMKRIERARKEIKTHGKDKIHPVLGKCVASYSARDYFRLVQKYGTEEVASDAFIKRYRQDPDMRDLCPHEV